MAASPPTTITFAIWGPIERDDLPGLRDRVCALARLQLAARRHRCVIRLRGASDELRALVAFIGLEDVLPS